MCLLHRCYPRLVSTYSRDHNSPLSVTERNIQMKTMQQRALLGFILAPFERKNGTMQRSHWVPFGSTVVLVLCLVGFENRAEAMSVTGLDFTSGAVNWDGRHGRMLDRLFAQDGGITMGSYQSMSDIVDPITHGHKTFSLFFPATCAGARSSSWCTTGSGIFSSSARLPTIITIATSSAPLRVRVLAKNMVANLPAPRST